MKLIKVNREFVELITTMIEERGVPLYKLPSGRSLQVAFSRIKRGKQKHITRTTLFSLASILDVEPGDLVDIEFEEEELITEQEERQLKAQEKQWEKLSKFLRSW